MSIPLCCAVAVAALVAGCAPLSRDVAPAASDRSEFDRWDCGRIQDEIDRVQQRAADVAWAVDERAGNNIVALSLGVTVFWPALLAMRPAGLEAEDLARLKGRYEVLRLAEQQRGCPPVRPELPADRAAALPVALGERLVYDERVPGRGAAHELSLAIVALRRDEIQFASAGRAEPAAQSWHQDLAGNLWSSPVGALQWQRLLKRDLVLGQVLAGDFTLSGDAMARARVRGQVVAVGPQLIAGRSFDAAVIELFGDALRAESSTRLDGVIVVDRGSGILLRLDLHSSMPPFALQRRLSRIEPAPR